MSAGRERNLARLLPCPARRAAGLEQVQGPGVRSGRNRHTPEYHAIRGFIKASPCGRRVVFHGAACHRAWFLLVAFCPATAKGPRANQHRMAFAPAVKPPLAVLFGHGPLAGKAFQQFLLGRVGRLAAGPGIDDCRPAGRLQGGGNIARRTGKLLPPDRPRLVAELQDVRRSPVAQGIGRRDGRAAMLPSSCHQCSTSRPKPRAMTRSMTVIRLLVVQAEIRRASRPRLFGGEAGSSASWSFCREGLSCSGRSKASSVIVAMVLSGRRTYCHFA